MTLAMRPVLTLRPAVLRKQMSAKKRLDMDEADVEVASRAGARAEAKGKRNKRKRKAEAPPKESVRPG